MTDIVIIDSAMTEGERQAGKRASALWAKIKTGGHWDEWIAIGEHLLIARREVMRALHLNAPLGRGYNELFSAWCAHHGYSDMDAGVRSNLLFCLEPQHRAVMDKYRGAMPASERQRINHPTAMARKIKAWLKIGTLSEQGASIEDEKPKRASPYDRLREAEAELARLRTAYAGKTGPDVIKPTGPDAAEIEHRMEAEIERRVAQEIERRIEAELARRVDAEMPRYREDHAAAKILLSREALFSDKEYRNILACLHSDLVTDPAQKKRAEKAFILLEKNKAALCRKPLPPPPPGMPRTVEELMMARERVSAERSRKAKEAAAKRKAKVRRLPAG